MTTSLFKLVSALAVISSLATIGQPHAAQAIPASVNKATSSVDGAPQVKDQVNTAQSAQSLMTQPKTVKEMFGIGGIAPSERLDQAESTIPSAVSQSPQPVKAGEAIADPAGALQRFLTQKPSEPKPMQPLELFKIPGMSSGVKLDVWKF